MQTFKKILCPYDFSDFSRRALDLAGELAGNLGAELEIAHVLDIRHDSPAWNSIAPELFEKRREELKARLAELTRERNMPAGSALRAEGLPHREILRMVRNGGHDLVVMGTHGSSGFERLCLGSVTEKVLHHVEVPLLTVSAREGAATGGDGANWLPVKSLILATDLGPDTGPTVSRARELAAHWDARLLVVHSIPTPDAQWLISAEMEREYERIESERREALADLMEPGERPPEIFVQRGSAENAILQVAHDNAVDLIVMGAHGLGRTTAGWLGSTCQRVIRNAPCPVLSVRP